MTGEMASTSAKGAVTLGPYKNGALSFTYPKPTVSDAEVEAQVKTAAKKTFKLTPVRFVEEGGTRMGHTVVCDWKATYVSGGDPAKHSLRPGAVLPRADIKNFVLELKEDQSEPLASFARAVASGMGQMETKVFEVAMPESATIESWRGVTAKIMLLVRSINIKENLAADGRSIEEKQAAVRAELQAKTDAAARQEAIAHFRAILLETTQTETEKMQESVSWAKFGENSLKDFKWSLIQEAIAAAEGIDFSEVPSFLLRENPVVWT
ncbi:hypothetical protein NSK_005560 [Nannochloropsis salina CCMP1776]|uniref:Trigger factor C-terminal domain-containing protein n=1 Tax=Nannochloropsis salina CCMP1776 TaxID=1027361 RepID=A0A4D9CVA6_9STRA|nr:hypothetical protein NSK_005560 [Nannochloropsis salina CCMP1776]|eukprot:TFJ83140.1 hypothetical protein NSK_005560 [Nannochloropsis salina CCMP1776]